jgi:hypothetical protein
VSEHFPPDDVMRSKNISKPFPPDDVIRSRNISKPFIIRSRKVPKLFA